MKNRLPLLLVVTIILFFGNSVCQSQTKQTDDPFLWLEEKESEKSLDWVKSQNLLSEKKMISNLLFEPMKDTLLKIYDDKDKIIYPEIVGEYVYNLLQDDSNERGVWRRILMDDFINKRTNWEVVLDIDALSINEDKRWVYKGADWLKPSNEICLLSLSDGGSDKDYLREFNTKTKEFVEGGFYHNESKGGASWLDENTILIARDFGEGSLTTSGYARTVKKWIRGTTIEKAELIFEGDSTDVSVGSNTYHYNGVSYTIIRRGMTFYESEHYLYINADLKKISIPIDARRYGVFKNEMIVYLQSNWEVDKVNYPSGALVSINFLDHTKGKMNVKTIYEPNVKSSFVSMRASKDFITVNIMENVQNKLFNYKLEENKWLSEAVEFPKFGSIRLNASSDQSNDYFFSYSNFITPTTLYHGDMERIQTIKKTKDYFSTENLEVHQYFATSRDGTLIPYFIVHKGNMQLNSSNPTVISAYGGFKISRQPNYNSTIGIGWLEHGGIFVLANIRGGGEYGPSWHLSALKDKRQNAFDDLYAVSEDLISKNITSANHLGIIGGSNGGLLVGVAFTQRPELYNAVVCVVPLLDMKRYSKLLAGASWMGEYGNPDMPEEWEYIKKYSPYQNVSKDKEYPEVFFITSTKDDRVHPGHARKMAAKMNKMGHSYFYHEKIEGGHGLGSTNEQRADSWARIYTYFNLKLN